MKAKFKSVTPYSKDAMDLPVKSVEAAIPFYKTILGFEVASVTDTPIRTAVLTRDDIQIGLAENGGDPNQEGCFFEVDNVETAFAELKSRGFEREEAGFKMDRYGDANWKVFFVIAPDELCYCLGERQPE